MPIDVAGTGADLVAEVLGLFGRQDCEGRIRSVLLGHFDHDVPLPPGLADRDDPRATLAGDVALDGDTEVAVGNGRSDGCHRFRIGVRRVQVVLL